MKRALIAAVLLLGVGGCGVNAASPVAQPGSGPHALPPAPPPPPMPEEGGACAADVRQCPGGSFVSRDAAQGCAFKACPGENQ